MKFREGFDPEAVGDKPTSRRSPVAFPR